MVCIGTLMALVDYNQMAREISFRLLDRVKDNDILGFNEVSGNTNKIDFLQRSYENWMKAIVISVSIPIQYVMGRMPVELMPNLSEVDLKSMGVDPISSNAVGYLSRKVDMKRVLSSFQESHKDSIVENLIEQGTKEGIEWFLKRKLNHDLNWFYENAKSTNKIANILAEAAGYSLPEEFGNITMKAYDEIDKAKPCLRLIHENKELFGVIKEYMDSYSRQDNEVNLTEGIFANGAMFFTGFVRLGIMLPYISSVAKCLSKYQNIPKYDKSEDMNIEEESMFFPTVSKILNDHLEMTRRVIDSPLIDNLNMLVR